MPDNPLLQVDFHIPFPAIKPEHVEPGIQELIRRSESNITQIAANTEPATFDNVLLALERATENLDYALGVVRHLESVATSPELRAAWNEVEPAASAFYSSIPMKE